MDCDGRRFGKLDECAKCECAPYCKDAGDLPAGSQHEYCEGAMQDQDISTVDAATFFDEIGLVGEDGEDMAQQLKDAFIMLSRLADGSETRMGIIVDRIAGRSYE